MPSRLRMFIAIKNLSQRPHLLSGHLNWLKQSERSVGTANVPINLTERSFLSAFSIRLVNNAILSFCSILLPTYSNFLSIKSSSKIMLMVLSLPFHSVFLL